MDCGPPHLPSLCSCSVAPSAFSTEVKGLFLWLHCLPRPLPLLWSAWIPAPSPLLAWVWAVHQLPLGPLFYSLSQKLILQHSPHGLYFFSSFKNSFCLSKPGLLPSWEIVKVNHLFLIPKCRSGKKMPYQCCRVGRCPILGALTLLVVWQ